MTSVTKMVACVAFPIHFPRIEAFGKQQCQPSQGWTKGSTARQRGADSMSAA